MNVNRERFIINLLIQPLIGITNSKILPPTLPLAHHRLYLYSHTQL
nr:MAG TPA: hypothetical protein [Bacteriophage sp.]